MVLGANEYNDDYPTCARTLAELIISGDALDLEGVTRSLGIVPSDQRKKGEQKVNSLGLVREAPYTMWILSSEGQVASLDLRRHLDFILLQLDGKAAELAAIREQSNAAAYVRCIWWARAQGGPMLSPKQMSALARFDLQVWFEFADFVDEAPSNEPV